MTGALALLEWSYVSAPYVHRKGVSGGVVQYSSDGAVVAPVASGIILHAGRFYTPQITPAVTVVNEVQNPSCEVGTQGTGGNGGGSTSITTAESLFGTSSLRAVCAGNAGGDGATFYAGIPGSSQDSPTQLGDKWMISGHVKGPPGSTLRVAARYSHGGSVVAELQGNSQTMNGTWMRISHLFTTPSGASGVRPKIYTASAQAITFYMDGVMMTSGSTLHPFTAPGLSSYATWNGSPNNSPSTINYPAGYRHLGGAGSGVVIDTHAAGSVVASHSSGATEAPRGSGVVSSPVLGGA